MRLRLTTALLCFSLILPPHLVFGEAVDDQFTQISPKHTPGQGEFVHGQGYGKILIRVTMLGSVPQQAVHYVPEGTDLLFGILYAGGYGETTKLNGITIKRRGVKELMVVDLQDLIEDGKPIPKLLDGDLVNVPFNWKKDYQEFIFLTSIVTSLTSLVLAVVALTKK